MRATAAALGLALAACGRLGFDPTERLDADATAGDAAGLDAPAVDPTLVLYMPFEGPAGDTFLSTNEYPTICSGGCPVPVPGRVGAQAADFSPGACVTVGASNLRPAQLTYAAWVRARSVQRSSVLARPFEGDVASTNSFEIYTEDGSAWRVTVNTIETGATAPLGEWHHVAGVFDGGVLRMYLDGAFETEISTGPIEYADDDLLVGCDINLGGPGDFFDGLVDDVRIYNRILTAAEIAALAAL